jgi:hypothetical protein
MVPTTPPSWVRLLEPYVKSQAIFYLPAQATPLSVSREQTRLRTWGMPMRWRFLFGQRSQPDEFVADPPSARR